MSIEAGEIDRVVAWEMSRLSRRLSTAARFMELCAEHAVALETINDMFPNLQGAAKTTSGMRCSRNSPLG